MRCAICNTENPANAASCRSCGSPQGVSAPHTSYTLPVGTKLQGGGFSVGKVLGQGGFGVTYLGSEVRLTRSVAIKEFFPLAQGCSRQGTTVQPGGSITQSQYCAERAKFLEEARRLAQFQHPSIVKVHSFFEENNTAYLVMEYLRGSTLLKILDDDGSLNQEQALRYIEQIGGALQQIHKASLLHRDIKPENIIITDDGRAVLIDFGTARDFAAGMTRRMTTILTPGYAPLEQYGQHARFGVYSDVYSLGATLYHLLTGEMPIQATDRAVGAELPIPRRLNRQIDRAVNDAVLWAMEMRIDKRPQSIQQFLDALRKGNTKGRIESTFSHVQRSPAEARTAGKLMLEVMNSTSKLGLSLSIYSKNSYGERSFYRNELMEKGLDRLELELDAGDYWLVSVATDWSDPKLASMGKSVSKLNDLEFKVALGEQRRIVIDLGCLNARLVV